MREELFRSLPNVDGLALEPALAPGRRTWSLGAAVVGGAWALYSAVVLVPGGGL